MAFFYFINILFLIPLISARISGNSGGPTFTTNTTTVQEWSNMTVKCQWKTFKEPSKAYKVSFYQDDIFFIAYEFPGILHKPFRNFFVL